MGVCTLKTILIVKSVNIQHLMIIPPFCSSVPPILLTAAFHHWMIIFFVSELPQCLSSLAVPFFRYSQVFVYISTLCIYLIVYMPPNVC